MKSFLLRHKFLVGVWIVVFGIGGYAGYALFLKSSSNDNPYVLSNSSSKQSSNQTEAPEPQETEPTRVKPGQAATNGSLEFNVLGVKCGDTTMGTNEYAHDEATGIFCRLSLSIKNIGTETASLAGDKQRIVDVAEKEYPLDKVATQYAQADPGQALWYEQIAPGTTVSGDLVFDVENQDIAKAYLYGGVAPELEVSL